MKCIAAVVLLALATFALAEGKPLEAESLEPARAEAEVESEAARDKRGLLLGAAYTAPVAYSAYSAPLAYSAAYAYPYGYSAYSAYPYYATAGAYNAPYVLV
ncbi:hypothetical protein KM043_001635 [Ampulex compressa]|nr:hypothetical protein KM043_001635 [Ampulex compressa]